MSKKTLLVYRSFANDHFVHIIGRVVKKQKTASRTTLMRTIMALLRSYAARPIKECEVKIISDLTVSSVETNENGIFEITCPYQEKIKVELDGEKQDTEVYSLLPQATYGIISDIDDTILISNATRTLKILYLLFTKNAKSRKPFPGVVQFYQALAGEHNPIFYVSSSAWNIYDLLIEFLDINCFPKGPLLLKELGSMRSIYQTAGRHDHKAQRIEMILAMYPSLSFILLGDSGQEDLHIYTAIALKHTGRIKVIYIRDINVKKNAIIKKAVPTLAGTVEVVFVKTSEEAAVHALQKGFIATMPDFSVQ